MISRYAATLFLVAFEADDINIWIAALKAWEKDGCPELGDPLTEAVAQLRKVWWHDGQTASRSAVHDAAHQLETILAQ